jgi:hypothetical protein
MLTNDLPAAHRLQYTALKDATLVLIQKAKDHGKNTA